MAEDDRIDRLIAALERFAQGPVPRRYLVRFPGYGAPDASCVVEAFNSEEAVQAAQLALYKEVTRRIWCALRRTTTASLAARGLANSATSATSAAARESSR